MNLPEKVYGKTASRTHPGNAIAPWGPRRCELPSRRGAPQDDDDDAMHTALTIARRCARRAVTSGRIVGRPYAVRRACARATRETSEARMGWTDASRPSRARRRCRRARAG